MIDVAPQIVTPRSARLRPRLGFAGAGWIGRHRMTALADSGAAEIAGVFEPSPDAARDAAAVASEATFTRSFEELLALDLDGVVIATPNSLHAEQAIAGLRAGCAVFCQKPLGRNAAETRAVIAAAREADRLLGVDLSYRFAAGMQQIRRLIHDGALGQVYAIEAVFHNAYGPSKPWFYDGRLAGGGCLLDLGIHLVDLALWALDFPAVTRVGGQVLRRQPPTAERPHPVEDYASATLALAGGASLQLACSWHAPAGCDARIGLTFFGTAGGAAFTNVNGSFYDFTAELFGSDRSRRLIAAPPDEWGGRAALAWNASLAVSKRFDAAVASLETVAETLDRIYTDSP
jgi:predicted dehydrogenase